MSCRFAELHVVRQRVTALCRARALEPGCQGSAKTPQPCHLASRQRLTWKTGSSRLRVTGRTRQACQHRAWRSGGCRVTLLFLSMAVFSIGPFWTRRPRVRPPRPRFWVPPLFPAPCQRSVERMARSTIWNPFDIIIYFRQAWTNCPSASRL